MSKETTNQTLYNLLNKLEELNKNEFLHNVYNAEEYYNLQNKFNAEEKYLIVMTTLDNPEFRNNLITNLRRIQVESIFAKN